MQIKNDLTYKVTREGGTEPPFSGEYNNMKKSGNYLCVNCNSLLFSSKKKFDSGSGWPSFYELEEENSVKEVKDYSHGMVRVEVKCNKCEIEHSVVFSLKCSF